VTRAQAFGLMAAIDADDWPLYRARLATILGQPGPAAADRTHSARRRAGSRRTKRHTGRQV
jgi:hypothetical protein